MLHPFTYYSLSFRIIRDDEGYHCESISRRYAANLARLSGRPALKRAYWSFFLWADGRWPAHLRPHLFCADNYRVVCWWVIGVSQSHTSKANLWPCQLAAVAPRAHRAVSDACVWWKSREERETIWHAGGGRPLTDLLIGCLFWCSFCVCVSVLKTTQYWENYTFNILTI